MTLADVWGKPRKNSTGERERVGIVYVESDSIGMEKVEFIRKCYVEC
jgi:hypothetical protein